MTQLIDLNNFPKGEFPWGEGLKFMASRQKEEVLPGASKSTLTSPSSLGVSLLS